MRSEVHHVVMVVSAGMPIFEAAVPCEVFGIDRSDLVSPWYRFSVVGIGAGPVALAAGFTLTGSDTYDVLDRADTLIVPACTNIHEQPPPDQVAVVRAAYERGTRILSICSGAFLLAAAGVLDGRRATTHWMHADELARRYPAVRVDPSVLYVDDHNVVTSAGTAAGIDACLHLVRTDHGAAVAAELARRLVIPPHRDGGQAQYHRLPPAKVSDDWLGKLLDWATNNLHEPLTTTDLATRAQVSVRTLERRFATTLNTSPLRWLLEQRIRQAQQLLETSDLPVDRISSRCGFGTPASLRAHFARTVGVPPTAYRRTFRTPAGLSR
ncbi:helix-turn-helix domain-containing protein [Micromonospora sp. NPDC005189]|uniref:GlxA family transcriptional regulator n=1 Tax=unclassified Micromonospora TaxID=2617518 RepID=UPI0033A532D6